MDSRSSQFNDRLVSVIQLQESLFLFSIGLQYSYSNHEGVLEKFLGKELLHKNMKEIICYGTL